MNMYMNMYIHIYIHIGKKLAIISNQNGIPNKISVKQLQSKVDAIIIYNISIFFIYICIYMYTYMYI
jgi:hypothetical protein